MPMTKVTRALGTTGVFLSATSSQVGQDPHVFWSYLVLQEAAQLVAGKDNTGGSIIGDPTQVAECFLYLLDLCLMGHHFRRTGCCCSVQRPTQ
jgi:hypothetical protein